MVLLPFASFLFFLVSNLALVKPEKTRAVENYLIQMARYGQLSGKVSHTAPGYCPSCSLPCQHMASPSHLRGLIAEFLLTLSLEKVLEAKLVLLTGNPK